MNYLTRRTYTVRCAAAKNPTLDKESNARLLVAPPVACSPPLIPTFVLSFFTYRLLHVVSCPSQCIGACIAYLVQHFSRLIRHIRRLRLLNSSFPQIYKTELEASQDDDHEQTLVSGTGVLATCLGGHKFDPDRWWCLVVQC